MKFKKIALCLAVVGAMTGASIASAQTSVAPAPVTGSTVGTAPGAGGSTTGTAPGGGTGTVTQPIYYQPNVESHGAHHAPVHPEHIPGTPGVTGLPSGGDAPPIAIPAPAGGPHKAHGNETE